MTIEEFARMNDVKPSTVRGWISKGFIPGAHDDYIPLSARRPYTDTRAKGGTAIIRSILFACENSLGITASLYGLSEPAFCSYIDQMLNDGYISSYEEDGATYYNIAPSGAELLRNWNKKDWKGIIQTVFADTDCTCCATNSWWFNAVVTLQTPKGVGKKDTIFTIVKIHDIIPEVFR